MCVVEVPIFYLTHLLPFAALPAWVLRTPFHLDPASHYFICLIHDPCSLHSLTLSLTLSLSFPMRQLTAKTAWAVKCIQSLALRPPSPASEPLVRGNISFCQQGKCCGLGGTSTVSSTELEMFNFSFSFALPAMQMELAQCTSSVSRSLCQQQTAVDCSLFHPTQSLSIPHCTLRRWLSLQIRLV